MGYQGGDEDGDRGDQGRMPVRRPRGWLLGLVLCASCVLSKPNTERLFVSGKAYLCAAAFEVGKPAVGKTIRLIAGGQVLAEDVVGPDGSFVLHPRLDQPVSGAVFIEGEGQRLSLANDYASWIQNHLRYTAELRLGCGSVSPLEPAPAAAKAAEPEVAEPVRPPPPSKLIPTRNLR